jgi:hypothetical protein
MHARWGIGVASFAFTASLLGAVPAAAQSDTTPPRLVSLSVSPNTVDASSAMTSFTVTAVITDDLSGVSYEGDSTPSDVASFAALYSPSGNQYVIGCPCFSHTAGDTYTQTLTVPQYAEEGIWRDWSIYLQDEAGNWTRVYEDAMLLSGINAAVGVTSYDTSYSRTITLNLSSRRASGNVHATLASTCFWFVPVSVEKRTASGWKKVRSTLAAYDGHYSVRIRTPGKYRATATEFAIGTPTITTCSKASAVKKS